MHTTKRLTRSTVADNTCPISTPISRPNRENVNVPTVSGERGPAEQLSRLRCRGVLRQLVGPKPARDVRNNFSRRGSPRCRAVQHDCGAPTHGSPRDRPNKPGVLRDAHSEGRWAGGRVFSLTDVLSYVDDRSRNPTTAPYRPSSFSLGQTRAREPPRCARCFSFGNVVGIEWSKTTTDGQNFGHCCSFRAHIKTIMTCCKAHHGFCVLELSRLA